MAAAHPLAWRISRIAPRLDPDICFVPGLGYVVSGAEILREILLDSDRFRKDGAASVGAIVTQVFGPIALTNMEGPAHADIRRELQALFAPGRAETVVAEAVASSLDSLRKTLHAGEVVDLARFSKVAAATVGAHVIGSTTGDVTERRALEMHGAATCLAGLLSLRMRPLSPGQLDRARTHLEDLCRGTGGAPGSPTVAEHLRSTGLDAESIRGLTAMLMVAGMETTSVALARVTALLSDCGWWPRLAAEAVVPTSVIDEAFRYVSPLPAVTRTVAADCEVRGRRLGGGRTLLGHLYNAVRDSRVIARGDDFDPDRAIPVSLRQLWFGAGAHFCIGMPLARALLVQVIGALSEIGGVDIVDRRPASRVLIPTYARLLVRRRRTSGNGGGS